MKKKSTKKKGFTLIELLVVVAIIALLAAISVVALNNARARARDSKRLADVKQIQTALELYYLDNNGYPATVTEGIEGKCLSEDGFTAVCGDTVYMAQVPNAPDPCDCPDGCPAVLTGDTYDAYTYAAVGSDSYTLKYCLGAASGGIDSGVRTATPAGISD